MLKIYRESGGVDSISSGGSYADPILFETDNSGGVFESKFWLRMATPSAEYVTDGLVYVTDASGSDQSSWVEIAPDSAGSPGTYDSTLEFELAIDEELPIWIRITVPAGTSGIPKTDLGIGLDYTRHII